MKNIHIGKSSSLLLITGVVAIGITTHAAAQNVEDLKTYTPFVLKAQGDFFIGGETNVSTDLDPTEILASKGTQRINQMYVQYMIPQPGDKVPVVLLHGGNLSGKSWGTTPDGRMGWYEFFAREGHPVYVPDQVDRGRSGWDPTELNDVWAGLAPPQSMSSWFKLSKELSWVNFRFGPTFGTPFPNTQFPVQFSDQFADTSVPDDTQPIKTPGADNPTTTRMAELATRLKGAVLVGHSQSGRIPLDAALLNPQWVKAAIATEPIGCRGASVDTAFPNPDPIYSDQQIATLAKIPVLVLFGDIQGNASWQSRIDDCRALVNRLKAAGGNATLLYLPEAGIHGNSHMYMLDKNNLQVGSLVSKWIDENVQVDRQEREGQGEGR
jgi:pimeloyl-ACP methyl ester carboxylesterase